MYLMEKWEKFFSDAGIPASVANTYAYTLAQNEMRTDMLTELNNDILKEMGISILGHRIDILCHSKHVCEESTRKSDRLLYKHPRLCNEEENDSTH